MLLGKKELLKALKGKQVLLAYDSEHKRELTAEVFAASGAKCQLHYAVNVRDAVEKLRALAQRGIYPDLIVSDYDFNDTVLRPDEPPQPNGGVFLDDVRRGRYDVWLQPKDRLERGSRGKYIPFLFDSGSDEPEQHRGRQNVYIRASGESLPEQCAWALLREKRPQLEDRVSRKRLLYPLEAELRDMHPDQGGYVANDDAFVRRLKKEAEKKEGGESAPSRARP